ncbi:hypothetical protein Q0590_35840 [Rhodocytophaga aerolata]|uniref:TonB-dependent receptor plug domain-containing protein n=1 Tax=Rhodocytophaga aerolata TaxID=455078 RepID=A0ABT8RHX1_9BACT|nr:hypothetical protein [Rhodocytophaga aerolata]MDO1451701.1 hypothetical protein [Rhodocytophaga aerolata]
MPKVYPRRIVLAISLLMSVSGCNKAVTTATSRVDQGGNAGRDSSTYVLTKDTLSFPFDYKWEELGDFGKPISKIPAVDNSSPTSRVGMPSGQLSGRFNFDELKDPKYLHFLNGTRIEEKKKEKILKKIKPEDVETIQIMTGEEGVNLYGQKAIHGVILIETKKNKTP